MVIGGMVYCCFTHIMDLTWCGDYVNGDISPAGFIFGRCTLW